MPRHLFEGAPWNVLFESVSYEKHSIFLTSYLPFRWKSMIVSEVITIFLIAAPPKPTGLEVLGIGETNVTLQWVRPNPPHGIIQEYRVRYCQ